ncbi:MAG: hypothetical protein K1X38_17800, partial [Microthrixaceae bacterium]|nr:hypothetical protein [Microthrixaceae bacterium]
VLRDGGVLLHVGPHKTGTTAIQGALAAARPLLKRERILYPGRRLEHNRQAAAAIQRSLGWDRRRLDMAYWDTLVAQTARYSGRVVISSEDFCEADPESAARIVHDLGPDRVQVAVTLRPLEKLLPSNWQQYIKSGYRIRYDHWLENVFESRDKASAATPSFWVRNDHPAVIRRWSEVIGPENLVVVVVDSAEPRSLFDSFEDILQLPRNSLNADESGPSNRSLSAYEVELLRQFNRRVRNKITHTDYYRFVKRGAVRSLVEGRTPGPHEPKVITPGWAIERARMISKEHIAEIGAMGDRARRHGNSMAVSAVVGACGPRSPDAAGSASAAYGATFCVQPNHDSSPGAENGTAAIRSGTTNTRRVGPLATEPTGPTALTASSGTVASATACGGNVTATKAGRLDSFRISCDGRPARVSRTRL